MFPFDDVIMDAGKEAAEANLYPLNEVEMMDWHGLGANTFYTNST